MTVDSHYSGGTARDLHPASLFSLWEGTRKYRLYYTANVGKSQRKALKTAFILILCLDYGQMKYKS